MNSGTFQHANRTKRPSTTNYGDLILHELLLVLVVWCPLRSMLRHKVPLLSNVMTAALSACAAGAGVERLLFPWFAIIPSRLCLVSRVQVTPGAGFFFHRGLSCFPHLDCNLFRVFNFPTCQLFSHPYPFQCLHRPCHGSSYRSLGS